MDDNESLNSNLSWGTQLTSCESFTNMLSKQWSNAKLQKHVMEVVISLRNTITKNGGSESSTEFYAALVALMKNVELDLPTLEACGHIMKALLSSGVSGAVLRHTTGDITKIVSNVFSGPFATNENVIRFGLLSLGKVLMVQSEDNWRLDDVKHMYRTLFAFTSDSRPKINEFARKAVLSIFESKKKSIGPIPPKHTLNKETRTILTNNIQQQNVIHSKNNDFKKLKVKPTDEDDKLSFSLTTLSRLLLAKVLSEESIVSYMETLIQCLMSMQIVPIQCQILTTYVTLFRNDILSPEVTARSLTSLFKYINFCTGTLETSAITLAPPNFIGKNWLNATLIGFESLLSHKNVTFIESNTNISRNCREVALAHGTNLIKVCSDWLLCQDIDMKNAANAILNKLCSGFLTTTETKSNYFDTADYEDVEKWLMKWTETLGRHLSTQHEVMWSDILENVTHLIVRSDGKCPKFIANVLQVLPRMAELRDSYEDTESEIISALTSTNLKNSRSNLTPIEKNLKINIESLIGNIIKIYGVDKVLDVLPLMKIINEDTNAQRDLNNRTWLVPLMKSYVQNTSLDKFRQYFLPFIQLLTNKIDSLSENQTTEAMDLDNPASNSASTVAIASLGTLRYQLWTCLPSFAKNVLPGSIDEVSKHQFQNKTLWDLLMNILSPHESTNLEQIALTTIRNIVKTAQDKEEMKRVMTSHLLHPNIITKLFSQYMKNDTKVQTSIKMTLDVYLRLFEPETFSKNIDFLLNKRLCNIDPHKASEEHLLCIELVIMLAPHLSVEKIAETSMFLEKFLDNNLADCQIQKRVYRYFEIVTASDTPTSNEYTKCQMHSILTKFHGWKEVKNDSWKCRIKSIYNILKLMNTSREIGDLLNNFIPEIIRCLALKAKKTRAVSGLILVEGIIGCSTLSEDEDTTLSQAIDRMLQNLISTLKEHMDDSSKDANSFKESLSKALFLVLSESRLSRAVTRDHIESTMTVVNDILRNHKNSDDNKHLVHVALDILAGLLKSKGVNFSRLNVTDFGDCFKSATDGLLKKVRTPVKRILRKMLKWWSYDEIKASLPDELVPVLRNLHKELNRANRTEKKANADTESNATSWKCFSETASNATMKNPNIKNIIDLLEDSDEEEQDLGSQMSGVSISNKSVASNVTKASELRKMRKRKIAEANATLFFEEKDGEVVDISDAVQMSQHIRIAKKGDKKIEEPVKVVKNVDKRGFKIEGGRLLIGNVEDIVEETKKESDDDDEDDEGYKTKKDRFQPPKKRTKTVKLPGAEYKSHKKGVFGDMKRKDKPNPYAYVPLTGDFHGVMKNYDKETKKCLKATRNLSKMSRRPSKK